MKTRPILFNAEMVQAVLAGRKTQTRRPIKPQPQLGKPWRHGWTVDPQEMDVPIAFCPYGIRGDKLWVRETWHEFEPYHRPPRFSYRADITDQEQEEIRKEYGYKWRPSIHMPRWASRLTLEVTAVRVERVQDISEGDAKSEGVTDSFDGERFEPVLWRFRQLWDSIYAKRGYGWSVNPWVWVVEFKAAQ